MAGASVKEAPDGPGVAPAPIPEASQAPGPAPEPGAREFHTYLFETGTHVLWAEEVAEEKGLPVEVVPAPPGYSRQCGLAVRTFAAVAPALEALLGEEGISFHRLP